MRFPLLYTSLRRVSCVCESVFDTECLLSHLNHAFHMIDGAKKSKPGDGPAGFHKKVDPALFGPRENRPKIYRSQTGKRSGAQFSEEFRRPSVDDDHDHENEEEERVIGFCALIYLFSFRTRLWSLTLQGSSGLIMHTDSSTGKRAPPLSWP